MLNLSIRRFASKISGGVTKNSSDSHSKRLGVKRFGHEFVHHNEILVRQRGFKWQPGFNVNVGKDHTIHSACDGYVYFERDPIKKKTVVSVVPAEKPERPTLKHYYSWHPELYPELAKDNLEPLAMDISRKAKPEKAPRIDLGLLIN